jgi:MFS family permease
LRIAEEYREMRLMTLIISLGGTAVGLFLFTVLATFSLPVFWGWGMIFLHSFLYLILLSLLVLLWCRFKALELRTLFLCVGVILTLVFIWFVPWTIACDIVETDYERLFRELGPGESLTLDEPLPGFWNYICSD